MSDKPKKTLLRKIMKRIALGLAVLLTLLVVLAGGLLLWLRSDFANSLIADQATSILKEQGLYLSLEELSGPLPGRLYLKGVELADEHGVWLRLDELEVELALLDLFTGTANIELVALNKPELLRLPELPPSEPDPEPAQPESGFDLNLPLDIKLGELSIKDAGIAWAVLGITPSGDGSLLDRAAANPLTVSLKASANLENGVAEAELDANAQAGEALGLELLLNPVKFSKTAPDTLGLSASANTVVDWDGRSDNLKISVDLAQEGTLWQLNKAGIEGLGLDLAAKAAFNQNTNHIEAELKLKGAENADWQNLAAGLAGQEPAFMAALGNPLSIDLSVKNSENGTFKLELAELRAGVISGQGNAAAHFPESSGLPDSGPGSVDADISIQVSELAPLAPQFGGSLATSLKASGDFNLADLVLSVTSPKLLAPGGEVNDLSLELSAALRNILGDQLSGNGNLKTSSSSVPGVSNDLIAMEADWQFSLNRGQGAESGSAQVENLNLQAFGLEVQGELQAGMGHAFFAAEPAPGAIWPAGLALDGALALQVNDWHSLAQLAAMQISGTDVNAQVQLANAGGTQNVKLDLAAKSLSLPEQDVRIAGLATKAEAQFTKNTPDIQLDLTTARSSAGQFEWADLEVKAEGNSGEGRFSVNMTEPPAPAPRKGKKAASQPAGKELIALSGTYDLPRQKIELSTLHAKYPGSQISVDLQNPANFSYANGIELHNLDLDIKPRGALSAEATIRPGTLKVQSKLNDLPFAVINTLAGTTLPPGQVDANIDLSGPSQGDLIVELRLDKKQATRPAGEAGVSANASSGPTASSSPAEPTSAPSPENLAISSNSSGTPDITLKAALGRSSGRLALTGDVDFSALTKMQTSGANAGMPTPGGTFGTTASPTYGEMPPLTFSLPMLLDSGGIPMPDLNGPFRADLVWLGEIAPLWQLVPMPDRDFSGLASVDFHLNGSLNSPGFKGDAYIAAGRFEDREFGVLLSDIKLEAHAASQKEFNLVLTASDGDKGKLGLEGSVNPSLESALNLRGRIEHLSPIHRDDIDLTITGLLAVSGSLSQPDVNVQTVVEDGEIILLDSLMGGSVSTLEISNPDAEVKERGAGPNLNVSVEIPRRFYIRGRGLDSEWQGKLNISGPSSAPEIRGNLKPVRGQFNLLSRNFNIAQGNIEFAGGTRINPGLNLALTYSSSSLEATVRVGGSLEHPSMTIESSPPLPQDEVLAQVLFGKNVSELSRFEALQLASGLRALADGGESFSLLSDMRESTGLDVLRVGASDDSQQSGPQASGQSGSSNLTPMSGSGGGDAGQGDATLEAGKYLNDSIYVGVEKGISQESTAVRVEIELFPRVTLQGTTSPDSSQVGIGWKKDY